QLLKRLLLNLVDNAFRHTPAGSGVELAVRQDGATAVVEVHDEGPGIAADEIPHIFDRFHRGKGSGAGSGLGLALCREIVAQHRGPFPAPTTRGTRATFPLPV